MIEFSMHETTKSQIHIKAWANTIDGPTDLGDYAFFITKVKDGNDITFTGDGVSNLLHGRKNDEELRRLYGEPILT